MTNMEKIRLCQEIVDQIQAESRRPVCRLHLSREPFGVADSHLGGVPYVPHNGQIPTDEDGNQLWLCAQINFAQMPRMEDFPESGILQIFLSDWGIDDFGLCGEDDGEGTPQDDWKIAYYPEVDETVTMEECEAKMAVPWAEASKKNMPRPPHQFDLQEIENGDIDLWRCPNVPLKMTFLPVEQEGVGDEEYLFDELFAAALKARLPDANLREFMPLYAEAPEEQEPVDQLEKQMQCGGCKIGGHPRYYQSDPRENPYQGMTEESLKKYNISPEAVQKALALTAWDTLLFQLDDDDCDYPAGDIEDMDLYLGGFGSLNLLIRAEDLKNRDFSRVLAQWACT